MTRAARRSVALLALALLGAAPAAEAQQTGAPAPRREALERRVREQMTRQLRESVGLTEQQLQQLREVNRRHEPRRRELLDRERSLRRRLRDQVAQEATADQQLVGQVLDELLRVQRDRLELVAAEQRDLARFMTPVQRAKLHALQQQLRRRLEDVRRRRGGRQRGAPAR